MFLERMFSTAEDFRLEAGGGITGAPAELYRAAGGGMGGIGAPGHVPHTPDGAL